jgi:fructose-1,6-bisphosphatase/inositol monophosphatase family enzyme
VQVDTSQLDRERWGTRLAALTREVRDTLRAAHGARADGGASEERSRVVRDGDGDTIFAIDVDAERILLAHCEAWAADASFLLVAEGLAPGGRAFGTGPPALRVIVDPIDGTRGLMFDKRSAWCLAAVAPERGAATSLADIEVAVMGELPTSRQHVVETLTARRGSGTRRVREDLATGTVRELPLRPSRAQDLRHGFATVCNFFQGGKELTSRIEEEILRRALGGWNELKAEVWADQYVCSGGQLAELALGRDRFVLDIRPLVHAALGHPGTLCSRPYDVCTALCATEAGCVVTDPFGVPLAQPLDLTSDVAFAAYANPELADHLAPIVANVLREML